VLEGTFVAWNVQPFYCDGDIKPLRSAKVADSCCRKPYQQLPKRFLLFEGQWIVWFILCHKKLV